MLKRIKEIKNMAVYKNFGWDKEVRDRKGNNIMDFKLINIIYGRNYSGKTTLSRIVRSMETGVISDKYDSPQFKIEFEGSRKIISQDNMRDHPYDIRVFNEDFIKENLKFISNPEDGITPFAILGDDNIRLEKEIKKLEEKNNGTEETTGLNAKLFDMNIELETLEKEHKKNTDDLNVKLRGKANDDIKENPFYGDVRYNITRIGDDINKVLKSDFCPLEAYEIPIKTQLIKEDIRLEIPSLADLHLKLADIAISAKTILEKEIKISNPISDLINNSLLQHWVKTGKDLHQGKRENCAFCGGTIPQDLWDKLDNHFTQESNEQESKIKALKSEIEHEISQYENKIFFSSLPFYSNFKEKVELIAKDINKHFGQYISNLKSINKSLDKKLKYVHPAQELPIFKDNSLEIYKLFEEYESLRLESNSFTENLTASKAEAKIALRMTDIHTFVTTIDYSGCLEKIKLKEQSIQQQKTLINNISSEIKENNNLIDRLKLEIQDEKKGAEKVNLYLSNYFGHDTLKLCAVAVETGFKFEVMRGDEKAHHLSEGERSLLAFCYFMAKLDDLATRDKKPIVWVDDPICSLDANHIFFVFSLISNELIKKVRFSQVFISTHNLDFLKYLKKIPGSSDKKKANYFIVERTGENSSIKEMPSYLKSYVTEFNYLFEQVYKCANVDIVGENVQDVFYNFGNNARKFLETFLYYKYPNAIENDDKYDRFFNDQESGATFLYRILNEYSHLDGVLERGAVPIEIPEMKTTAQYILSKIKSNDEEQYTALLKSIGVVV